jgi:branched-chain amino acid transport system permease protein
VNRVRELFQGQPGRQGGLLVAMLLSTLLFPKSIPSGIFALGATAGVVLALQAAGIVLVYRSNRIINFAQVAIGGFGGFMFQMSETYRPLLRWFSLFCGDSCNGRTADQVNYWVSFVLGILLSVGLSGLVYLLVVKRFATAPRMLLTVATIFVAPALTSVTQYVPSWFRTDVQKQADGDVVHYALRFPIGGSFSFGGARFHAVDVVSMVTAAVLLVSLAVYLKRSRTGVAIRATSENPERAATLGIDVGAATAKIWLLSGLLAGVAGVFLATVAPSRLGVGSADQLLLLTGAAIAGMTSLPLAVVASLVLDMVKQATQWAFGSTTPFSGALLLVLAVSFTLQRTNASRGEVDLASTIAWNPEIRPVPQELAGLSTIKLWRRSFLITALLAFLAGPLLLSPAQVDALTTAILLAMIAASLIVLSGWAGQISLGQIGFAGIGAYVAIVSHLPFYLAIPLGILAGAAAAVLVGFPALRLRGLHLAIISLAVAVTISTLVIDPQYGGSALPTDIKRPHPLGIDLEDARVYYYVAVVALLLTVLAVMGLRRSRTARALIAARDNELAAQSLGIGLIPARLTAFAVSGGLAAAAGVLMAYQQHAVQTGSFDAIWGVFTFQAAVFGGLGTVLGPLLGIGILDLPAVFTVPSWIAAILTGAGALAVVLMIPGGIAQALFDARDQFLRRLAHREGIDVPSLQGQAGTGADEAAPLLPRSEGTGADVYVPVRYRLADQWALKVSTGDSGPAVVHEALTGAHRD